MEWQPRAARALTNPCLQEVFDIRPLRETEESASSMDSTSCHGEPAAQAADSLSSSRALPPRAASGEHRSEHKSSRRRSFHFPFGF